AARARLPSDSRCPRPASMLRLTLPVRILPDALEGSGAHHLALVGRTDALFADDAIARLHKASLGLPRMLNNAATAVLIAATTAGKALVDDECAKKAVAELTRD